MSHNYLVTVYTFILLICAATCCNGPASHGPSVAQAFEETEVSDPREVPQRYRNSSQALSTFVGTPRHGTFAANSNGQTLVDVQRVWVVPSYGTPVVRTLLQGFCLACCPATTGVPKSRFSEQPVWCTGRGKTHGLSQNARKKYNKHLKKKNKKAATDDQLFLSADDEGLTTDAGHKDAAMIDSPEVKLLKGDLKTWNVLLQALEGLEGTAALLQRDTATKESKKIRAQLTAMLPIPKQRAGLTALVERKSIVLQKAIAVHSNLETEHTAYMAKYALSHTESQQKVHQAMEAHEEATAALAKTQVGMFIPNGQGQKATSITAFQLHALASMAPALLPADGQALETAIRWWHQFWKR